MPWLFGERLSMRRRDLLALLGVFIWAWSAAAGAQDRGLRRIGILMPITAEDPTGSERDAVFLRALQERGWIEGRNLRIDRRWAEFDHDLVQKYAMELVALEPEVILAGGGGVVRELQKATRSIPIVFTAAIEPVSFGYVESLARPGGNTTGFINIEFGFSTKYLELLKEIAPTVTRAAVLRSPGFPAQSGQFGVIKRAAPSLGMEASPIEMRDADEIERAITAFAAEPNGGLIVTASSQATVHSSLIVALAARYKLPAVYPNRLHVAAGGLISYGPVFLDQYRRAADYVDRILKGAKPADLPVQAPVKYEMAVNLKTARDLGLAVPRIVLVRANEIME
jgi:putative tryptophan/tyrosine transport system substrate-binding protein